MKIIQRFMQTLQILFLIVAVIQAVVGLSGLVALAQDSTAPASVAIVQPSKIDMVLGILKAVLPTVMASVMPLITKGVAHLIAGLSPTWGAALSLSLGTAASAFTAALEGLPADAYAVAGAGTATVSHAVLQTNPAPTKPAASS